jgi:hypothetical protein
VTPLSAFIHIKAPTDPNTADDWLGVNVYYRKVIPGQNPDYTKTTFKGLSFGSVGGIQTRFFSLPLERDVVYQVVIVPLVFFSGAETESLFSLVGQGYYHANTARADYPSKSGNNWVSSYNFAQLDTSTALGQLQSGFAGEVIAVVNSWKIFNNPNAQFIGNFFQSYYEVVFDVGHIVSFEEAYIWRRNGNSQPANQSLYWGTGQWEKITLTTAFSGYNSTTKKFTVNLKMPISFRQFRATNGTLANLYQYAPPLRPIKPSESNRDLFYIQIKANGTIDPRAIKLVGSYASGSVVDIGVRTRPVEVVFSTEVNDDQYTNGWLRKTTEAVTATNTSTTVAPNFIFTDIEFSSSGKNFRTGVI